jgi:hypothetical protein
MTVFGFMRKPLKRVISFPSGNKYFKTQVVKKASEKPDHLPPVIEYPSLTGRMEKPIDFFFDSNGD